MSFNERVCIKELRKYKPAYGKWCYFDLVFTSFHLPLSLILSIKIVLPPQEGKQRVKLNNTLKIK